MNKDIADKQDIRRLVDTFYVKVKADPEIGFFFTEVVELDWQVHIPIMYDFWDNILFGNMGYKGNPVLKHVELHQKHPIKKVYFDLWLELFNATLDELFEGKVTELAKNKANTMAQLMMYKIEQSGNKGYVQ